MKGPHNPLCQWPAIWYAGGMNTPFAGSAASGADIILPDSNPVFGLELRGFEPIPGAERNMGLGQIAPLWLAVNMNLVCITLGCLTVATGLNLWMALAACVVGNIPFLLLGHASVGAARLGLPVTTLSRAAYGTRGNVLHAGLTWLASVCYEALNTVFGVLAWLSLSGLLGWDNHSVGVKLAAVAVQLAIGGGVAVLGHATMVWLQRVFTALLGIVLLMVLGATLNTAARHGLTPPHAPAVTGWSAAAAFMTACGLIASQPISYLYNGPDWVRYLPLDTPARSITRRVFWWTFLPCLVLTGMGALWASLGDMSDPVAGLAPLLPRWLYILFILAVIAGSVANNAPTFYSSGLSLQATGVRLSRWSATALDIAISTLAVLYILFVQDLTTVLNNFIALLIAWSGPYAGVWLADGMRRGWRLELGDIHRISGDARPVAGWRAPAWIAFGTGLAVAVATMKSPAFTGPVAAALGGMDLSWLLGFSVTALTYLAIAQVNSPRLGAN